MEHFNEKVVKIDRKSMFLIHIILSFTRSNYMLETSLLQIRKNKLFLTRDVWNNLMANKIRKEEI
jgi:hypothetical protein